MDMWNVEMKRTSTDHLNMMGGVPCCIVLYSDTFVHCEVGKRSLVPRRSTTLAPRESFQSSRLGRLLAGVKKCEDMNHIFNMLFESERSL